MVRRIICYSIATGGGVWSTGSLVELFVRFFLGRVS